MKTIQCAHPPHHKYAFSYIYIYIYIILSGINRTTINFLPKVSGFFHDLQVNALLTKIFLVLESFVN